jgi:hypothetical protein
MKDGTKNNIEEDTANGAKEPLPTVRNESSKAVNTPTHGSIPLAKNLYRSNLDSGEDDKNWTWVGKSPEIDPETAEGEETTNFAIIIRNTKSQDSRKKFEAHSIIVQSPWLKRVLDSYILNDYPGVACQLSRLEFKSPFKPFVHRWGAILKFRKRVDIDPIAKAHTNLLYDILESEIGDSIKTFQDYVLNDVITFDHLWMIYEPGRVVLSDDEDSTGSAFELHSSEYKKDDRRGQFLRLKCECVDWGGKFFCRRSARIDLDEFHGTKKIQTLHAFPLRFHKSKELIETKLIERGRKFESLRGYHYKA